MMRGRGRRAWRDTAAVEPVEPPQEELPSMINTPMDVKMGDASDGASDNEMPMEGEEKETRKRPWEKLGGVKVKRKKVPGAKNLKIRRYVQPKNAVMCLNELQPGVVYTTEQEGGVSQPFCVSVEVLGAQEADNQKYRGFGTSKQLAKQAAAEAALISFVKPPVVSANAKEAKEEDKTPWATLASFAIYKLFNDWRDGRVGMCPPPPSQPYGTAVPPGFTSFLASAAEKEEAANAVAFTEAIAAHLGGRAPHGGAVTGSVPGAPDTTKEPLGEAKVPKPAKQVPENAAAMHPVMVLHQMKPGLQYNISQLNKDGKIYFAVTCDIDGSNYIGEGSNVKKAKFNLAKSAISGLYGVDSIFEPPAS